MGGPLVNERACSLALLGAQALQHFARSSSGVMGESSAGAMSKMVRQPVSPAQAMRQQARAQATSTLPVNSGLESSFSEYSDHVGVLAAGTRGASADDRAAVGNAGVIAVELFLRNEGDRGVVVGEVVRHRDDGLFDGSRIGTLLGTTKHSRVCFDAWSAPGWHRSARPQRLGTGTVYWRASTTPGDAADGVGVPLGDAAAPEGVVGAVGHDGVGVNARDREHARIPAHRDDGHVLRLAGHRIDGGEVRRDVGMGVEGVDHVVERSGCRGLLGQVGGGAARRA